MLALFQKKLTEGKALDPSKEPSGFLTAAYVGALGLIAMLALGSHFIIVQMTHAQKEKSELVYIAGRQRVTVQQVALHASNFMATKDPKEKNLFENAYFSFKLGHDYLVRGHGKEKAKGEGIYLSPKLYEIYFEEPVNLHRQAQEFIRLSEEFMRLNLNSNKTEFSRIYDELYQLATGDLIKGLDIAAQQYQEESIKKISRLTWIQTIVFLGLIITLILEALFIFRPLAVHVKKYSRDLIELALKDALTGLYNRRAFIQDAEAELSRAKRHKTSICVVLCDIDKFKSVNDTHGHNIGDQVLKHVAKVLSSTFRNEDVIGRIGGEEFAFILPETNADQALQLMDKVRMKVENTPCICEGEGGRPFNLGCTASFGVAQMLQTGESLAALMARADKALYQAKDKGRNCVVLASQDAKSRLKAVD